jgi:hypothetical protein
MHIAKAHHPAEPAGRHAAAGRYCIPFGTPVFPNQLFLFSRKSCDILKSNIVKHFSVRQCFPGLPEK